MQRTEIIWERTTRAWHEAVKNQNGSNISAGVQDHRLLGDCAHDYLHISQYRSIQAAAADGKSHKHVLRRHLSLLPFRCALHLDSASLKIRDKIGFKSPK